MFSGKSTYILQKIERSIYGKQKVCLVRPKKDTRGYFSHSGNEPDDKIVEFNKKGKLDIIEALSVDELDLVALLKYDVIMVDEFFMIKNCKELAKFFIKEFDSSKMLYFAGLIATSENELFKEAKELLPYADDIVKLNGVCMLCGSQMGGYSMYKGTKSEELDIGDEDKYLCVCSKCYNRIKGTI